MFPNFISVKASEFSISTVAGVSSNIFLNRLSASFSNAITVSGGSVTGTGQTINLDLANSGVSAGTYVAPTLGISADGRILSAVAGAPAGVQSVAVTSAGGLTVTAPVDTKLAPPGYYMLFIVNSAGVPSVAPIVKVQ